jgi:hypothetical protein
MDMMNSILWYRAQLSFYIYSNMKKPRGKGIDKQVQNDIWCQSYGAVHLVTATFV